MKAVGSLGPAIELADLPGPPSDVEAVLAGNIFHRSVILGAPDTSRAGVKLDGLAGLVFRRGAQVARQEDLQANIGNIVDIVAHVAGTLAANGERLAGGRRDHHGLDRPTAHDRAGRDRIRLSARPDGQAFGQIQPLTTRHFAKLTLPPGVLPSRPQK